MLGFFRKYQKFVLAIVTFVVVLSFTFFGAYRAFSGRQVVEDKTIGRLVDGSALKEQRLFALSRLLQYGAEEGGRMTNLLNDSFVHKEILLSGLGELLVANAFEEFEEDLAYRWKRAKAFAPYEHPSASFISAKAIWAQFAPEINTLLEELKGAPEELTLNELPLLFKFYVAQAQCPPALLHQVLSYQEQQFQGQIRPDSGLPHANVALFGFQSIEDWFGPKLVSEVGKLILNVGCIARDEGYSVTFEEAQSELVGNVYRGLKLFSQGETPSQEEVLNHYAQAVSHFGLTEKMAVDLWREVALFKRMFHEVGDAVFVDSLALDQFKQFAKPSHHVSRFSLPKNLQFTTMREMLKFQRYLELVATEDLMGLPTQLRDPQEVMDAHGELVYKLFEVEIASVTKRGVAARVSLKETWQWELQAEHFAKLQEEFPQLRGKEGDTLEKRTEALESLDEGTRFRVDQFARLSLIETQPELIDETLFTAPLEKKEIKVRLKGGDSPFSGSHFLALLEGEHPDLARYSADGENFYAIHVLSKGAGWHYLPFEMLSQDETLDEKLDELLQEAYVSMDREEPFDEVKEEIAFKVYADLFESIRSQVPIESIDEYPQHRFDGYLSSIQKRLKDDPELLTKLQEGPWPLDVRDEALIEEPFQLAQGEFSPVINGGFYRLDAVSNHRADVEEIASVKGVLKRDAELELLRKILNRV